MRYHKLYPNILFYIDISTYTSPSTMSSPFNPYAEQHKDPKGPGDDRPTALQILKDNKLIGAWADKVVLITGATSGIGIETTRAMYATGARVFILVRDTTKAQPIVDDIVTSTKGFGSIGIIQMDLDSLESVKNAAKEFLEKSSQLNVLINNAGMYLWTRLHLHSFPSTSHS